MSEQAVETVTEDRTGPLRAPASQNELQSRTSGARSLNTAFGSFVEVFKLFRMNHLHIMGFVGPHAVAEVEIRDRAPRQSQAQPQAHNLRIKSTASVYHYR